MCDESDGSYVYERLRASLRTQGDRGSSTVVLDLVRRVGVSTWKEGRSVDRTPVTPALVGCAQCAAEPERRTRTIAASAVALVGNGGRAPVFGGRGVCVCVIEEAVEDGTFGISAS